MRTPIPTLFRALALTLVAALPARAEIAIDIEEVTSPGGISAWLVEEPDIPFVALELRFRGGASLDPGDSRGAVNFMTGLLEEGAADRSAQEFAQAREALAASFDYDAGDDTLSVSARFLTENREEAVDLLRTSLVEPRFDEDAIERVRAQILSGLASDLKDPNEIAARAFDEMVFGDHPYGSSYRGTPESIQGITRDDLVAAHDATMARDRLHVSAVGDITADELGPLLDRLLGDLPAEGAPLPDEAPLNFEGQTEVVSFATPQSVAIFGQPGIDREDEDFFAAYLLSTILGGGGFESRLMQEVREERGLTYGIYAYLAQKDYADLYVGRVASANDRISETVEVVRDQWRDVAENGVTAEELEDAKTYLTGAYPLRFDGNGQIANILAAMQLDGMPIDYAATRNERVEAVTLDDVNRVASELLNPEALSFVIVGQPEGL